MSRREERFWDSKVTVDLFIETMIEEVFKHYINKCLTFTINITTNLIGIEQNRFPNYSKVAHPHRIIK